MSMGSYCQGSPYVGCTVTAAFSQGLLPPEGWALGCTSPRSWGVEAGGGGGQSGRWTWSLLLGFEDTVMDEAQALREAGNQALWPATEQRGPGEPPGRDHRREGTPEEHREGRAGRPGHQSSTWPAAVRGQRRGPDRMGSAGPRQLQLQAEPGTLVRHQEYHCPAASGLMALGRPPGCSVTFQHQWQGLTEPGGR